MRDVAFVFQQYSLYPHLTVYDNLAFPLRSPTRRVPEAEIRVKIEEVARLLHIETSCTTRRRNCPAADAARRDRPRPGALALDLSDGRATVLARTPSCARELRLELKRIQQDLGATILYVTHDQTEAMTMAAASASSTRAGWCRSARRARSTRTRSTPMSPRGWASRRSTCCRRRSSRQRRRARPRRIGARTEHLTIDARRRRRACTVDADRASRRPEPSPPRPWRPPLRDAGRTPKPASAAGDIVSASRSTSRCSSMRQARARGGMSSSKQTGKELVRALAEAMIAHADELTALDQAIGDGDHGLNMKRGFEAVLATLPALPRNRCRTCSRRSE